jgi:hypothetical protein
MGTTVRTSERARPRVARQIAVIATVTLVVTLVGLGGGFLHLARAGLLDPPPEYPRATPVGQIGTHATVYQSPDDFGRVAAHFSRRLAPGASQQGAGFSAVSIEGPLTGNRSEISMPITSRPAGLEALVLKRTETWVSWALISRGPADSGTRIILSKERLSRAVSATPPPPLKHAWIPAFTAGGASGGTGEVYTGWRTTPRSLAEVWSYYSGLSGRALPYRPGTAITFGSGERWTFWSSPPGEPFASAVVTHETAGHRVTAAFSRDRSEKKTWLIWTIIAR